MGQTLEQIAERTGILPKPVDFDTYAHACNKTGRITWIGDEWTTAEDAVSLLKNWNYMKPEHVIRVNVRAVG